MKTPLLSVIIPVCNVEKYLAECLDSALGQTLDDMELICVDDGSTDSSAVILDAYAQKDSRVRVLHKANAGFGHTMNCGLRMARGKYVAFLESDDFIVKDAYAELIARAEECGSDIVKGDYFEVRGNRGAYQMRPCRMMGRVDLYNQNLCPRDVPYLFYVPMMNPMGVFRGKFLRQNAILHNETPGASFQDMGFWFQAFCLAKSVHYMDKPFYCYRKDNPSSSMNNMGKAACIRDEYTFMWHFLEDRWNELSWGAPIYYHRLFGSFLFRYINLVSYLKPRFLMDVFRDELVACVARPSFTDARFSESERIKLRQIIDTPDAFLLASLAEKKVNEDMCLAYCAAERRANALSSALAQMRKIEGGERADDEKQVPMVKVSIIIPVYNVISYIDKCIDSVLNQTLREIEVICVDDGSTDGSCERLRQWADRDSRVKVISQANCGQSVARNRGLDVAGGKYVYCVDSDDWLADVDVLTELYREAEEKGLDLLSFDAKSSLECDCQDRGGRISKDTYIRKHDYVGCKTGVALLDEFVENNEYRVAPFLVFLRRAFLQENGIRFYAGIIYEDNIFMMRCMLAAKCASHVSRIGYVRRVRSGSTMTGGATFKSLYGYLTCYIQLYLMQVSHGHDERAVHAIDSQLLACRWQVRRLTGEVKNARALADRILTPVERTFYRRIIGEAETRLPSGVQKPTGHVAKLASGKVGPGTVAPCGRMPIGRLLKCIRENGVVYTVGDICGRFGWR